MTAFKLSPASKAHNNINENASTAIAITHLGGNVNKKETEQNQSETYQEVILNAMPLWLKVYRQSVWSIGSTPHQEGTNDTVTWQTFDVYAGQIRLEFAKDIDDIKKLSRQLSRAVSQQNVCYVVITKDKQVHDVKFYDQYLMMDYDHLPVLTVFNPQEWQHAVDTLMTPCELWRFLLYYAKCIELSTFFSGVIPLIEQFLHEPLLFEQSIAVDNALVATKLSDTPNSALVSMALAFKTQNATVNMYRKHLLQASDVWNGLWQTWCQKEVQHTMSATKAQRQNTLETKQLQWLKALLDESLFSRHELVRAIYDHHKQPADTQKKGYVRHQHSYESLGRHYMFIFYGSSDSKTHSRKYLQPRLQAVAQNTISRLNLPQLHTMVLIGVEFIAADDEWVVDLDVWIQTAQALSTHEQKLTEQIKTIAQKLHKQNQQIQTGLSQQGIDVNSIQINMPPTT